MTQLKQLRGPVLGRDPPVEKRRPISKPGKQVLRMENRLSLRRAQWSNIHQLVRLTWCRRNNWPVIFNIWTTLHPHPSSGTACATVRHSLGVEMTSMSSGGNSIKSLSGPESTMGGWVMRYSSKSTGSTASVRGTCSSKGGRRSGGQFVSEHDWPSLAFYQIGKPFFFRVQNHHDLLVSLQGISTPSENKSWGHFCYCSKHSRKVSSD